MLEAAIEHRLMHAETLTYMLHRLPTERKIAGPKQEQEKPRQATQQIVDIPAGTATLGMQRSQDGEFGWDNEFGFLEKHVPGFAIESLNVTNRDFLRFVEAGGYQEKTFWSDEARQWIEEHDVKHPAFWSRTGNSWMYRTMFGEVPLPADWPAYVSHAEASAYAKWMGRRLPTEEQFHRAAYGTPEGGAERRYPWGDEPPTARHGNFDFHNWNPTAVGTHPAGASAFGVQDVLGNGWEWTRTKFGPLPGFTPMSFYPTYSANFFDGKHYVMKGGSQRTAACMLRRSFRNWFQPHYPYIYAAFRCVED
jgi:ergothioneine biosynthesis protein EgtB